MRVFTNYSTADVCVDSWGKQILLFMATDEEILEYTMIRMGAVLRDRYDVTVTGSQPKN